ncbi:MAG: hypothetical protein U5L98_16380 [Halomonas sp.]|uniref:hypothetical protein n=1 Tax=Halomonas sp. TaxID=1486246 RepID=UPI002ACD22BD|nr:hypothetical protein [Halomonas sp.]MDZ7854160.1 hypothetical protein [Halomonas sp.]
MALTPQHVTQLLNFDEVAYLLEGLDPEKVEECLYSAEDLARIPKWQRVMADAIQDGSLQVDKGVCVILSKSMSSAAEQTRVWPEDLASLDFYDPRRHDLVAWFRRKDVYCWLKSSGGTDEDIPEALRVMPDLPQPAEPGQGQSTEGEELRALEAFGLLVEVYVGQRGPDYHYGTRPKASRIVKDMLAAVPDDVTNMGDRKLKEHVGAAIKAWEAKKRR